MSLEHRHQRPKGYEKYRKRNLNLNLFKKKWGLDHFIVIKKTGMRRR